MVINENILNKAVNESIDEFLLEEGWGDTWNTVKDYAGKAWNWAKNGLAMYMDNATNGEWNRKYNIHAKGKGFMVGGHYFEKWLKQRYYKLQDLIYGEYYGDKTYYYTVNKFNQKSYFTHDWINNCYMLKTNNGKTYKLLFDYNGVPNKINILDANNQSIESTGVTHNKEEMSYEFNMPNGKITLYYGQDSSTPEEYIAKECTPQNFLQYSRNVLEDGYMKNQIINYINEIQNYAKKKDKDYKTLINMFDIRNFYKKYGDLKSNQQSNTTGNNQQKAQTNGQGRQNSTKSQPDSNTNQNGQTKTDNVNTSTSTNSTETYTTPYGKKWTSTYYNV